MKVSSLILLPAMILPCLLPVGCSSSVSNPPAPATASEPTLAAQVSAIRAGTTDIIHLEAAPLTDADLDLLVDVPGLSVLQLDHGDNQLTVAGLTKIAQLQPLVHLRIRGGAIGDEGLKALSTMSNLQILNLPQGQFTDAGLARLKELPKLQMLRIGSPHVTDEGIAALQEFPELRRIHLIDIPITDRGLAELRSMPRLESLYLDGANISDAAVDELFQKRPDLHVHFNQAHHDRDPHQHDHLGE